MSTSKRVLASAILGSVVLVLSAGSAPAQVGTGFTYQGRLTDGGGPASGVYDLELRLFAGASGGSPVVPPIVLEDVTVANGLFTVTVDFGAAAFTGSARWLEIGVRPGPSTGAFTTLGPRQELTPSPNALFSAASPWSGLIGVPPGFADGTDDDSGGDITSVSAGTGLTGGALSGAATLAVDTAAVQSRVTGTCPPGQSIRTVNADGTVVCEVGTGWGLTGNAGTNPATQFLGTTDNQLLALRTNNAVGLRLVPSAGTPSVVGGYQGNDVTPGVAGAFIGGGGFDGFTNRVTDNLGVVGGGMGNRAGNDTGTLNDAYGATVAGGLGNTASSYDATVGGGNSNTASGLGAVAPGGYFNVAGGDGSFAGGFRARVRDAASSGDADGDEGSFVWADYAPPFNFFTSSGPNQFLVRAAGGVGINANDPGFTLDVNGPIRSRFGGLHFPDGTNQTTAATNPAADITAVNTLAGSGLQGGVASGAASLSLLTCPSGGQILKWNGSWACASDLDTNSGGTVTSVATGAGLTGGPITLGGTVSVATGGITSAMIANGAVGAAQINQAQVQARVSGTCPAGTTIQTVNGDGTVVCGTVSPPAPGFVLSTLDSAPAAGFDTSVTIGTDGLGLISYRTSTAAGLRVAHCANTACTTATLADVDAGAGGANAATSITIGTDGRGLIAYYDSSTELDLKVAHCTDVACSSSTLATLDSVGDVGQDAAVAIGLDGLGLISYWDITNRNLKVAHCSNTACSTATVSTLDSVGEVGSHTSIAIGTDGLGLISYYDAVNGDLKVAHCLDLSCTSAAVSVLDPVSFAGQWTSLAIGVDGLGLISYWASGDLRVAHCANVTCTSATVATVDNSGTNAGVYSSLTIGDDGLGLISYQDNTPANFDLRVAHCVDVACTSATVSTLDTVGDTGRDTSITIGTDGLGLISYRDATNFDLKVAHCSNLACLPHVRRR